MAQNQAAYVAITLTKDVCQEPEMVIKVKYLLHDDADATLGLYTVFNDQLLPEHLQKVIEERMILPVLFILLERFQNSFS